MTTLLFAFVALPQATGTVAFVGSKNGQTDLFTVRPDGSELRQLTNDTSHESEPTWSPDGTKIAFVSTLPWVAGTPQKSYLCVVNANGTGFHQVIPESIVQDSNLSWSPDGAKIAFEHGGQSNIGVASSAGSPLFLLTNTTTREKCPIWGPDNRVYFAGERMPGGYGIYSVSPDGTGERLVTTAANNFSNPIMLSPDGRKMAYRARTSANMTLINPDGSMPTVLGGMLGAAQWSQDGRKIAFVDNGNRSLSVMLSTDGQEAVPLAGTAYSEAASISPDGQWVAFAKRDDPNSAQTQFSLCVLPIGSSGPVKLNLDVRPVRSSPTNQAVYVRWSPTAATTPPVTPTPTAPGGSVETSSGAGFPGTPVGPDRSANPLGAAKTTGTDLAVTIPESVTVGDAFFRPEPINITIRRSAALATKPVSLSVVGAPAGVTATVSGAGAAGTLVLKGLSSLSVGEHALQVKVVCGMTSTTAPVRIVRKKARILLVDDDREGNNAGLDKDPTSFAKGSLSKSDAFYRTMLERGNGRRSLIYDTVGVDMYGNGPDVEKMQPYDLVIWYTGVQYGGNPDGTAVYSGTDESNIRAYLGEGGGRTLMMIGPGYVSRVAKGTPTSATNDAHWTETDSTFLKNAMGVQGGRGLHARFVDADLTINGQTYMMGKGPLESQLSAINPSTSTALATAELDPDRKGKRHVPVAVWNRVGDANLVYVGFTLENVAVRQDRLAGLLLGIRIPGMSIR